MDKRSRLEREGADKSTNGRKNNTKEDALDKLRLMEWKRNRQDPWHLARPDSRNVEGYVKKKHNNDEDCYFEGTGNQKSRKVRKPRQVETIPAAAPSGFARAISSAPPPINAWEQKKGSALFNKQAEEVDEEDEMLKMVIKESLKTAEEDQRRNIERMKMHMREMPTFQTKEPTANDWKVKDQCSEVQDQYSPSSSATNRDLQFIDSDSSDDTPPPPSQIRKPPPSWIRKSSSPNEKPLPVNKNNNKRLHSHEKIIALKKENDLDMSFEPSQPHKICHPMGKTNYDQIKPPSLKETVVFTRKERSPQVITEGKKSNITSVNDLSKELSSNLTFGDMQSLEESNYDNYSHISQDEGKHFHFEKQSYVSSEPSRSMPMVPNSTSTDISLFSENVDDTDRILHSFIRHNPPKSDQQDSLEFYSKNNPLLTSSNDPRTLEQNQLVLNGIVHDNSHSILKNGSGQDTRQAESNSPFQNISPYGSFGKETLGGLPQNVQQMLPSYSVPYAVNVQSNQEASRNLHAMQLAANHNLASHMAYGISPGFPLIRSITPGLNQYGYPNTNVAAPPNVHDLSPPQRAMNAFQYQQTQLTGMEAIQSEPNILQSQPQMISPVEHQSQVIVSQNQLQMLQQSQFQMHSPVNQLVENTMQKPVELAHEAKQISSEQSIQQPTDKTRDELQLKYVQAVQYINQLEQRLANTPRPVFQEHQLYNYPCTLPIPIGSNNNMIYPGVQMMPQQPLPTALVTQPSQESPNIQTGFPDLQSLLNTATGGIGSSPPPSNTAVGRGRGRLQ